MGVILVGCGGGEPDGITIRAANVIKEADLVIGSGRLLEGFSGYIKSETLEAAGTGEIFELINNLQKKDPDKKTAVLFSGDTGIFSGAQKLGEALENAGFEYEVIPGVSSFALMAGVMKRSYRDALLLSCHGREVNIIKQASEGRDMYVLTDGKNTPNKLCKLLCEAGLSSQKACVGTNLSYVNQTVTYGTVSELSDMEFPQPAVLFVESSPKFKRSTPGIRDEEFIRGDVPMTKQVARAAILSLLDPSDTDVCWDLGAGTGSVSVELAMFAKTVYAVEKNPEAVCLIKKNREKFCSRNIKVVEGPVEECTGELDTPDKVFIGGSGGRLEEIMEMVFEANRSADVVMTAVTLETLNKAIGLFEKHGKDPEVMQISVSKAERKGNSRLMRAENPVFIISCKGDRP